MTRMAGWGAWRMGDFFDLLDTTYTPRGGPIGVKGVMGGHDPFSEDYGADVIKSSADDMVDPPPVEHHRRIGERLSEHIRDYGPFTSRAELSVLLRKHCFDPNAVTPKEQIKKMTIAIKRAKKVMGDRFGSTENNVAKVVEALKASILAEDGKIVPLP